MDALFLRLSEQCLANNDVILDVSNAHSKRLRGCCTATVLQFSFLVLSEERYTFPLRNCVIWGSTRIHLTSKTIIVLKSSLTFIRIYLLYKTISDAPELAFQALRLSDQFQSYLCVAIWRHYIRVRIAQNDLLRSCLLTSMMRPISYD